MPGRRLLSTLALGAWVATLSLAGCAPRELSECRRDSHCDDRNECTVDRCDAGRCVHTPDDEAKPVQRGNDPCRHAICRGGERVIVADDRLVPNDGFSCTKDVCSDGEAVFTPEDERCGAAPACQRFVCDPKREGAHKTTGCVAVNDDAQVPDDGFACTADACENGVPVHMPRHAQCAPGGSSACVVATCDPVHAEDGSGCVVTLDHASCDDTNPCTADACDPEAGCLHVALATRSQTPGNCHAERCVSGLPVNESDPADLPANTTGLSCVVPSCEGGIAHLVPTDARCGGGTVVCDPNANPATNPSGCVDLDACPPVLDAHDGGVVAGDTSGMQDDFSPSCSDASGAHPDLAYRLTLVVDSDVQIHAQAADGRTLAVALVQINAEVCGRELACAAHAGAAALGVVNLPAGHYAIVVDGDGPEPQAGEFELSVATSPTTIGAGDLVFNELMADPAKVGDAVGEYVEIANPRLFAVSTWRLRISKDAGATSHAVVGASNEFFVVPAGGFLVAARSLDPELNGGVPAQLVLPFTLANGSPKEQLRLFVEDGKVVDDLDLGAAAFPAAKAGQSIQLDPRLLDAGENDFAANWCLTPSGTYGLGDKGTPGLPNEPCSAPCESHDACDDANPCTTDRCDGGLCRHEANDAVVLDGGYACVARRCASGLVVTEYVHAVCDDEVACTADQCVGAGGDATTGCRNAPDDALCSPGQVCDPRRDCRLPPPAGDACGHPLPLGAGGSEEVNLAAMEASGAAGSCAAPDALDAFFSVTLAATSTLVVELDDASAGRSLALFEGTCAAPRQLACVSGDEAGRFEIRGLGKGTYFLALADGINPGTVGITASVTAGELNSGDLVISELMIQPKTLSATNAEWVELANPSAFHVATALLKLHVGASQTSIASSGGQLVAPPGGFLLAVRSASANGGLVPDFTYTGSLVDSTTTVTVRTESGAAVDAVTYQSNVDCFPKLVAGQAFSRDPSKMSPSLSNQGASWCDAKLAGASEYESSGPNYGTPRAPNPACTRVCP